MSLIIPDAILQTTRMSEGEMLREIAVMLYQKEKMTAGQASNLAKMSRMQFQHLLASRQINIHYDVEDFEQDLKTLKEIKQSDSCQQ